MLAVRSLRGQPLALLARRPSTEVLVLARLVAPCLLGSCIFLTAASAAAETPPAPPPLGPYLQAPVPMPRLILAPESRYRSPAMRNTGISMTIIAIAHAVIGASLFAAGVAQNAQPCNGGGCNDWPPGLSSVIVGSGFLFTGGVASIIGSTLWAVGSRPPREGAAAFTIRPSPNGLGFVF